MLNTILRGMNSVLQPIQSVLSFDGKWVPNAQFKKDKVSRKKMRVLYNDCVIMKRNVHHYVNVSACHCQRFVPLP